MAENSGDYINNQNNNSSNNNNNEQSSNSSFTSPEYLEYLKSMDATLKQLLQNSRSTSQSDAKNSIPRRDDFSSKFSRRGMRSSASRAKSSFTDEFEKVMWEAVLGSDFKEKVSAAMNGLAKEIGVEVEDIPGTLGREVGKQTINAIKKSKYGSTIFSNVDKLKKTSVNYAKNAFMSGVGNYDKKSGTNYRSTFENIFKSASNAKAATREEPKDENLADVQSGKSASEVSASEISVKGDIVINAAQVTLNSQKTKKGSKGKSKKSKKDAEKSAAEEATKKLTEENSKALTAQDAQKDSDKETKKEAEDQAKKKAETANNMSENYDMFQAFKDGFGDSSMDIVSKMANSKFKPLAELGGKLSPKLASIFGGGGTAAAGTAAAGTAAAGTAAASSSALVATGTTAVTASTAMAGAGASASALGAALSGAASAAGFACPPLLLIAAAGLVVVKFLQQFGPAIEGTKALFDKMKASANRYQESRKKNLELEQKRLADDVESMIKEPFDILKESAQSVYDAWDKNVRLINGTQGYNKSDLQNLMGSYAERLRSEGLTSVVSAADITDNLAKVLESGLSGTVAEEFAYIATILNAAVPTQDFFGYASTYSSIAANAKMQGMSESEAIARANEELQAFAGNVLYASRNLSGGFSTGLKDAQSMFEQSTQIVNAAKTGNVSEVSGVFTSVAAIVGAVAPDLATSMTDAIVKAATGGNSSEIVALRSLAGVNASNTEFLKQVANNPQKVFTTLFTNLAEMQNMSNGAFMEVAEGLSSVFGVSMDAFARIDFNSLAKAISEMNVNNASLSENIDHLASGETTTTAEQLKYEQANQYMIENGLALVLDNEVARSIQEHMWDEQIARDLMESTYAVELQGSALQFLEGIKQTVDNIINFLNPLSWMKKLANLAATATEGAALNSDIAQLLKVGAVGNVNSKSLYQLTTRGTDLNLTKNIVDLMGGHSLYDDVSSLTKVFNTLTNASGRRDLVENVGRRIGSSLVSTFTSSSKNNGISSAYTWGTISKSAAAAIASGTSASTANLPAASASSTAAKVASTTASQSAVVSKLNKMLEESYIQDFVNNGQSYEDWAASASKFGISNLSSALEEAGFSEEAVRGRFTAVESRAAAEESSRRQRAEEDFWKNTQAYELQLIDLMEINNQWVEKIFKKSDEFLDAWTDYFINHTAYSDSYNHTDVDRIRAQEKDGATSAITQLAESLVKNSVDLRDPQVQTNALLSQILLVAQAIMNQTKTSAGALSLPDTFSMLAAGLTLPTQ